MARQIVDDGQHNGPLSLEGRSMLCCLENLEAHELERF
jgi:hypothetical protein